VSSTPSPSVSGVPPTWTVTVYAKSSGALSPSQYIWWSDDIWFSNTQLSGAVSTSGGLVGYIYNVPNLTTLQLACDYGSGGGPAVDNAGTAINMAVGSGYPSAPSACSANPYGSQAYRVTSNVTLYITANAGYAGAC